MLKTTPSLAKQRWGFVFFKVALFLCASIIALTGCAPQQVKEVSVVESASDSNVVAADLAVTAVEKLCSFSPQEYETNTVALKIKPYSHPQLYQQVKDDQKLLVATISQPELRQWKQAGGTTTVKVKVTEEDHPKDTDTSWARKVVCEQTKAGVTHTLGVVYLVVVTKEDQQWGLSELKLLSSTNLE